MATPKPLILSQFLSQSQALMKLEASFLDLKSRVALYNTCKTVFQVLSPKLRKLKEEKLLGKVEKLLDNVLNIDEKRKNEILVFLESPDRALVSFIILMRANGQVKYRSSTHGNRIIPRAEYNDVSPLEAAAMCGDFHLVKLFEQALPDTQKHTAGLQLNAVIQSPNFLSAFKALQRASRTYLNRYEKLVAIKNWATVIKLWEQTGEALKNLSNFGLNVICNPVPYPPLPDFTQEPERTIRVAVYENGWKIMDLSLDSIGDSTECSLYMELGEQAFAVGRVAVAGPETRKAFSCNGKGVARGVEAIDLLLKVLPKEFKRITNRLLSYPAPLPAEQQYDPSREAAATVSARPGPAASGCCVVS